jgi:hypothetical protein
MQGNGGRQETKKERRKEEESYMLSCMNFFSLRTFLSHIGISLFDEKDVKYTRRRWTEV